MEKSCKTTNVKKSSKTTQKYVFTGETERYGGYIVHRIKRLSDGKVGGWIQYKRNLSQEGNCWVDGNAVVCCDAIVEGNAVVKGNAFIGGKAQISGNAQILDRAVITDNARVYGDAMIFGNSRIINSASVYDKARVYGRSSISGHARVCEEAGVHGDARICNDTIVYGKADIFGEVEIYGSTTIGDDSVMSGHVKISDYDHTYRILRQRNCIPDSYGLGTLSAVMDSLEIDVLMYVEKTLKNFYRKDKDEYVKLKEQLNERRKQLDISDNYEFDKKHPVYRFCKNRGNRVKSLALRLEDYFEKHNVRAYDSKVIVIVNNLFTGKHSDEYTPVISLKEIHNMKEK